MRRISAWLGLSLCFAGLLTAIADGAQTERLIFLSTQLRPIEEAQKMRNSHWIARRAARIYFRGSPRRVARSMA
jgi:hypothetical protein